MVFLNLALKSLRNRIFASILTVIAISLSVTLLLTVERARRAAEDGFTQTISKTDLIVGARSGPLQLILYTVFNMGSATHNISYKTYEKLKQNPAIAWTIPYSLGDGHRGFRVVGTTQDFFEHYHFRGNQRVSFRDGHVFDGLWDVVIGADVAKTLKYRIGDRVVLEHGVTKEEGFHKHDERPFVVVGVMSATGTPLDRAVYISLKGMEALHLDWEKGAPPTPGHVTPISQIHDDHVHIHSITSFFVGAKNRIDTLRLQREINNFSEEPLLAIIPGVTLSELWAGLSYVEGVLKMISLMVVFVGFLAMLIALTTSLNERRREMSILRAVGASPHHILGLLVFESAALTFFGIILGVLLSLFLMTILKPLLESQFGLYLAGPLIQKKELVYLLLIWVGGIMAGLLPALRAQRLSLKDGLSVKL